MKSIIPIFFLSVVVFSCSKEVEDSPLTESSNYLAKAPSYYRKIVRDAGGNLTCHSQGGNCLPEVVVKGIHHGLLGNFISATNNGDLKAFFDASQNGGILFKNFSEFNFYLADLQSGKLTFSILPSSNPNLTQAALHPFSASNAIAAGNLDDIIFVFPLLK